MHAPGLASGHLWGTWFTLAHIIIPVGGVMLSNETKGTQQAVGATHIMPRQGMRRGLRQAPGRLSQPGHG